MIFKNVVFIWFNFKKLFFDNNCKFINYFLFFSFKFIFRWQYWKIENSCVFVCFKKFFNIIFFWNFLKQFSFLWINRFWLSINKTVLTWTESFDSSAIETDTDLVGEIGTQSSLKFLICFEANKAAKILDPNLCSSLDKT